MFSLVDYDYELPKEFIAQTPSKQREQSRLLSLSRETGKLSHHKFYEICDILLPSDVLVINNTEVIPGRLFGKKETGGKAEILILNYASACKTSKCNEFVCNCLIKSSKRLKINSLLYFDDDLKAVVINFCDGIYTLKFLCDGNFETILYKIGKMPLPPYIKRNGDKSEISCDDKKHYQTVYASQKGAIAAPTAGLHFSKNLLEQLKEKGITIASITLHVGYGTFLPVRESDIRNHKIHSEWFSISKQSANLINSAKANGNRIVAVGTTCVRTLEYASDENGKIACTNGNCDLFIYSGYNFKVVDAMITNFHLPKSTLLMLVSAFAGRTNILNAYKKAINKKYRFYSYGDAMFIA